MKKKLKYENYIKKEYGMDYQEEETKKENPLTKAKTWSLIGKVTGGVVIITACALKWCNIIEASIGEILACGLGVMGVFGTIDINLIIDKFVK